MSAPVTQWFYNGAYDPLWPGRYQIKTVRGGIGKAYWNGRIWATTLQFWAWRGLAEKPL